MRRVVFAVVCLGVLALLLWSRAGDRAGRAPVHGDAAHPAASAPPAGSTAAGPQAPAAAPAPPPDSLPFAKSAPANDVEIALRVLDVDGAPAAGARVRVLRSAWPYAPLAEALTRHDGRASVPTSRHTVCIVHAALEGREAWAHDVVPDGREREVRLEEALGVEGRVVDADGGPVAGAEVMLCFAGPITGAASAATAFRGITGERGTLALPLRPIHAKPYLRVMAHGYAIHWSELDGTVLGRQGFTVQLEPLRTVTGRLLDQEGNPVGDVSLILRETILQARSAPDGTFELPGLPRDGGTLIVEPYGHGRVVRRVDPRTTDLGDLVLAPGRSIRGRVVDADGTPAENVFVHAICNRTNLSAGGAQTTADGRFEIRFLDEGPYRLSAQLRTPTPFFDGEYARTGASAELPAVRASDGEVELRLEVKPLLKVDLVSKGSGEAVWVLAMNIVVERAGGETILQEVSSPRKRRSNSTWVPLPAAGTYEVRVRADAYPEQTATITVAQDELHVLRVELPE